jgi:glutathione S-transferase
MNKAATFELSLSRSIRAPRERVFDAFVKPEMMNRWMCPRGMTSTSEADARVGGRYRITMRARDGEQHVVGGEYREIARPERLVYTWTPQGEGRPAIETLITVRFEERDGVTEVTMTHTGFPDMAIRDSHLVGWNGCLNQLVDFLDVRGSAASLTLLGDPRSTFVRTTRLALAEKGVACSFEPAAPHSPPVDAIHPFGRIPAFRDGDFALFESVAIVKYVNETFPGPSLVPNGPRDRARAEQWTSAILCYVVPLCLGRFIAQYAFPKDGTPDRQAIDAAVKEIPRHLAPLDKAIGQRDFVVGNAVSIPDLLLAPLLDYVEQMPEGKDLLAPLGNLRRSLSVMRARGSWKTLGA